MPGYPFDGRKVRHRIGASTRMSTADKRRSKKAFERKIHRVSLKLTSRKGKR